MEATTTHGAGAEVVAEAQVEMIRHHRMTTNRLADRRHRQRELLRGSKGTGLVFGQVRWAVLPPVTLPATEAETNKREIKVGAISKVEESLEEQTRVEGSSGIMQEKEVRYGVAGVVLGHPGPHSRLRGTKVLVLDPPVADKLEGHGKCRPLSLIFGCFGH